MSKQKHEHANEEEGEEPDWKLVAVGGGLGYAIGGPVGGAAGAALTAWISQVEDSESLHDQTLATAARNLREHASETGSLYIAHVNPSDVGRDVEDGNPQGIVAGINGDPDILYVDVQGPRANLVVEVETPSGLHDQADHTLEQLEDYRTTGFKRLLVMPDGEVETAEDWVEKHDDDINGELHITGVSDVALHF